MSEHMALKINYHTESMGLCKSCGKTGVKYRIQTKGNRKGERFIDRSAYYKVFEEVSVFRGEDEYLGKFCRDCFKNKKYQALNESE